MASAIEAEIERLIEECRREREQEFPPCPEGQEARWHPDLLRNCEWPENCCPTVALPCEQCPYYRPKH